MRTLKTIKRGLELLDDSVVPSSPQSRAHRSHREHGQEDLDEYDEADAEQTVRS